MKGGISPLRDTERLGNYKMYTWTTLDKKIATFRMAGRVR